MSVAFYIVLDKEKPGFETFVNGKALAKDIRKLDAISKKLGLRRFDDFVAMSGEDVADLLGEDAEAPSMEEKWFTADEGLMFVSALIGHINSNPKDVTNAAAVVEDLKEYAEVLSKAKGIGAKWHLNVDI